MNGSLSAASQAGLTADRLLSHAARMPLDEEMAIDLADAALDSAREEIALPHVEAVARRIGSSAALWQWTALLYRELDRREEALACYGRAERLAPLDPRILHGIARTRFEAGYPAVESFDRALRRAPQDAEVFLGRAAALCAAGQAGRAIADFETVLARSPHWIDGHRTLGQLHWAYGDRAAFTRSLDRALVAQPRNPALWLALIAQLLNAARYGEALAAVARGRAQIGNHVGLLANEAAALSELGRHAEADRLYQQLPDDPEGSIAIRHIRHLLRTGRAEEAAARAESLLSTPAETHAWPYLSIAWRLTGDPRWSWLEGNEAFIRTYDLEDRLPPLDRVAEVLRGLHLSVHQPLDQSLRGGTQTDGVLFHRLEPEIRAIRAAVIGAVEDYRGGLPEVDPRHPLLRHHRDRPVRFAGSWSVRLTDAGFHAHHVHPAGCISSALYIALPAPVPGDRPEAGWLTLGEPQAELGIALPPIRRIEPRPGRLALFPSTMWHGTVPFESGERMTVAMDVAPPRS